MAAVANSPKFAKKVGVPQSVGKEFAKADKAKESNEEEEPEEDEETFDSVVRLYLESSYGEIMGPMPPGGYPTPEEIAARSARRRRQRQIRGDLGTEEKRKRQQAQQRALVGSTKAWTGGPQARGARNPVDVKADDWATPELKTNPKYKALSPANKTKLQNRVKGEILGRPTPGTSKSPSTVKRGRRGTGRFTPRRSQQSRAAAPLGGKNAPRSTGAPAPLGGKNAPRSTGRPAPASPEKTWAGKAQGRPDPTPSVAPKGFGSQAEAKGKVPFKTKYGTVWRKPSNPPGSAPKGFTRSQVPASRGYYNVKPKPTAAAPAPAPAPAAPAPAPAAPAPAPAVPGDEEGFDATAKRYLKKKKTKK